MPPDIDPLRHHRGHEGLTSVFGADIFGRNAEKFARFFGTPKFIVGQTVIVVLWIVLNVVGLIHHWDVYPFILLNLCFSTQAAYAAPLILLAQTRQADRDKANAEADARHREDVARSQESLITANTALTSEIFKLSTAIHTVVAAEIASGPGNEQVLASLAEVKLQLAILTGHRKDRR